jgi:spermidine synthase
MKPRRILESVVTPDHRHLVLSERDGTYSIDVDGKTLMSSREHGSEEELARLAIGAWKGRGAPRVLVGGLGMGFTLRAVLDALPARSGALVEVAEVFPSVVAWNRGPLRDLAGRPLADRRVHVHEADVGWHLDGGRKYDIVLLDVDNGPEEFTLLGNHELYTARGLERIHRSLAPGGVLAVWSTFEDDEFTTRLRRAGFAVTTHRVRARPGNKGGRHTIFVALPRQDGTGPEGQGTRTGRRNRARTGPAGPRARPW